jgi:hypothetical protein
MQRPEHGFQPVGRLKEDHGAALGVEICEP